MKIKKKIAAVYLVSVMTLLSSCGGNQNAAQDPTGSSANSVTAASEDGKNPLFSKGLLAVKASLKWGYTDETGKYVINPQFDYATNFYDDGYAVVSVGEKHGTINTKGEYVVNPQIEEILTY